MKLLGSELGGLHLVPCPAESAHGDLQVAKGLGFKYWEEWNESSWSWLHLPAIKPSELKTQDKKR